MLRPRITAADTAFRRLHLHRTRSMNSHERRQRAAALLLQGLSPSKIADEMHLPLGAVMNFLYNQVGQGRIRRSDILFSIDAESRRAIEEAIEQTGKIGRASCRERVKIAVG